MTENPISVPDGAICLTATIAKKKLGCSNSWFWDRVKNDPDFPKPIYISARRPIWIESSLDNWLRRKAAESQHV